MTLVFALRSRGGSRDKDMLARLSAGQSDFDEEGELCVLEGVLYLASRSTVPTAKSNACYLTISKKMRYIPFCADFGPFNLGEGPVSLAKEPQPPSVQQRSCRLPLLGR
jgi:hypothetical protein